MLDSAGIVVDLLHHYALVLFQVGETLLEMGILLFLCSRGLVVSIACQLQLGHDMRHLILIHSFQHMPHLFNFASVRLLKFLVFLQLIVGLAELCL